MQPGFSPIPVILTSGSRVCLLQLRIRYCEIRNDRACSSSLNKRIASAICLSTEVVAKRYMQAKAYIDRFAAVVLGALGFRLFLSRAEIH